LPVEDELLDDVIRDLLAAALLAPEAPPSDLGEFRYFHYPVFQSRFGNFCLHYAYSRRGYSFLQTAFVNALPPLTVLDVHIQGVADWRTLIDMLPEATLACIAPSFMPRKQSEAHLELLDSKTIWGEHLSVERLRAFVHPDALTSNWSSKRTLQKLLTMKEEARSAHWVSLVDKADDQSTIPLDLLGPELSRMGAFLAAEYRVKASREKTDLSRLLWRLVKYYLGVDPWIPFSMTKRRLRFKKAFRELAANIEGHLATLKEMKETDTAEGES
jgi:hypothetical protein